MPTSPDAFMKPAGVSGLQPFYEPILKKTLWRTYLVGETYDNYLNMPTK